MTRKVQERRGHVGERLGEAPQTAHAFAGIVEVDGFLALRREVGGPLANAWLAALGDRVRDALPSGELQRVGRGFIEFLFRPGAQPPEQVLADMHAAIPEELVVEGLAIRPLLYTAAAPLHGNDPSHALDTADQALDEARAADRRISVAVHDRIVGPGADLMRDLQRAIADDTLKLHYQPKLRTRDDQIHAVEGLLRWPARAGISIAELIATAEATGNVKRLTEWVVARAIRDQAWLDARGLPVTIAVNVSGSLLADIEFADWMIARVRQSQCRLIVEITETAVISHPEASMRNLNALVAAGVKIAIDDYGSGLSSLAYLKQLPAHELKIDRLFVANLTTSHRDPLLVRSSIDLAHALEMEVTAEGVDNPATLALLRIMGCDQIQGFLLAPALPLEALTAMLRDGAVLPTVTPLLHQMRRRAG